MKRGPRIAVLVGFSLLLLTPLAYGTPPDSGWISGFWDDGDHDDVVSLVAWLTGTPGVHADDSAPSAVAVGLPIERDSGTHLAARLSVAPTRAPPAA